jgi:hypothetical protein
MKDEQRHADRLISCAENGVLPPTKKRRYRMLEERINVLKAEYHAGTRPLPSYWRAISHVIHTFG